MCVNVFVHMHAVSHVCVRVHSCICAFMGVSARVFALVYTCVCLCVFLYLLIFLLCKTYLYNFTSKIETHKIVLNKNRIFHTIKRIII